MSFSEQTLILHAGNITGGKQCAREAFYKGSVSSRGRIARSKTLPFIRHRRLSIVERQHKMGNIPRRGLTKEFKTGQTQHITMPETLYTFNDLQTLEQFKPEIINGTFVFDASTADPEFVDLSGNKDLKRIIFKTPQPKLRYLDASSCALQSVTIPAGCESLETLFFHKNQITEITFEGDCPKLELLDLSENKLTTLDLPYKFKKLGNLFLSKNNLVNLANLSEFFTRDYFDFVVDGNERLTAPPPELIEKGNDAVVKFFIEMEAGKDYLYEAKLLIVGEPGAGKTTLFRKLKDTNALLPKENETTKGIDIHGYTFPVKGKPKKKFTVNVWDFGGQEIYHATHQFFLTKRSLYVLLSDARKEDTDFNYWLEVIELLTGKSPVIIVQNEKGGRKADFDQRGLAGRFGNIVTPVHSLDLSKDINKIDQLREFVSFHIQQLDHVGQELPASWVAIREELEKLSNNNSYIDVNHYLDVCKKNNLHERNRGLFLSSFLHDLGVFLHFQNDPILKHWVILSNEWATNAVYAIMDDEEIKHNRKGHFNRKDIQRILTKREYCYMHDEVLQLMMNFELCYRIPETKDEYIAPQLLPIEKSKYPWENENNLQLRYTYDFMPKGLISRFIVRTHQFIDDYTKLWRSGVVLSRNKTFAEVIETYGRRSIQIRVAGLHKKELLTIVSDHLDTLNKSYEGMNWDKMVPCNCEICLNNDTPNFYKYADLNRRRELNKRTVECPVSYEDVEVQKMLDDVFVTRSDVKSPLKVFISYSKHDLRYLKKLKTFITPLMRDKNLIIWDDKSLIPGEEWDKRIRYELMSADIIIFLISPDFLATEYIYNMEMKEALDRHERGEARMIPVIIRPCLWESSSLARFNIIPEKGKPLSSYNDEDEGWKIITKEIEKVIEGAYQIKKL
nr:TIR domain-containing protein [Bacteroidota bacterium]